LIGAKVNAALAVRLGKLAIDGEKTLEGVAELAHQQSFQVSCFHFQS